MIKSLEVGSKDKSKARRTLNDGFCCLPSMLLRKCELEADGRKKKDATHVYTVKEQ